MPLPSSAPRLVMKARPVKVEGSAPFSSYVQQAIRQLPLLDAANPKAARFASERIEDWLGTPPPLDRVPRPRPVVVASPARRRPSPGRAAWCHRNTEALAALALALGHTPAGWLRLTRTGSD